MVEKKISADDDDDDDYNIIQNIWEDLQLSALVQLFSLPNAINWADWNFI